MADNSQAEQPKKDEEKRGMRRIWESLQKSPKLWGSGVYLWLSLLGMLYARSYYQSFEIDIFNFVEPSDFLLIVFSKINIVFVVLLGILLVLVLVTPTFRLVPLITIFLIFSIVLVRVSIVLVIVSIVLAVISLLSLLLILITLLLYLLAKSIDPSAAWDAFMASRREWKPFTVSFRAAWDAFMASRRFTELLRTEWKNFTTRLGPMWKTFIHRLDTAWGIFTKSLNTSKASHRTAQEKYKSFFWRFLYRVVLAMLIFGSVYVPRHQGERAAHALVRDLQGETGTQVPLISQIDTTLSYINSRLTNNPLTVSLFGKQSSQQEPQYVRVTIRQDVAQPTNRLPDSLLFLGTTSSFHFFYECGVALIDENGVVLKNKDETPKKCEEEDGRPFVIPTANIASLEFIPAGTPSEDIAQAVKELDLIINDLRSEEVKVTNAITQINTTITSINMSSGVHAKFITQQIESPKPEVVANLGPDKIITVAIALKSYLEGNIPVTHLNETITTLNATIKTLNQADVLDPDLANIAGAINSLNPLKIETPDLKGIAGAINNTNPPPVVINPDLSKITEKIDENTTKIITAIKGLNLSCGDPGKGQNLCPQGLWKVMIVSSFPEEDHEISGIGEGVKNLVEHMRTLTKDQTLQQLIVIEVAKGNKDEWKARHYYNSKTSLVKARTKWVLGELKANFPEQKEEIEKATILRSAEPQHLDVVVVLACMSPKPDPKPEQASPSTAPAATTPETPPQEPAAN